MNLTDIKEQMSDISDEEFEQLKSEIETTIYRLRELQAQHRRLTGRDYVPPIRPR